MKSSITAIDAGVQILKQGYEVASPVVVQGIKVVTPYVEQAIDAATPTFKAALPVIEVNIGHQVVFICSSARYSAQSRDLYYGLSPLLPLQGAEKSIEASIKSEALDTVVSSASKAATAASPIASKVAAFIASSDPVTLGEYALGSAAFVYLFPSLLGILAGLSRSDTLEIS